MRSFSGEPKYCIHVFGADGQPIYYRLSEQLTSDGVTLDLQTSDAGVITWAAVVDCGDKLPAYVSVKAHERRINTIHEAPGWFCRPVRGRHATNGPEIALPTVALVRTVQLALVCPTCGSESYTEVRRDQYRGLLGGTIKPLIPRCGRCGGSRWWEPLILRDEGDSASAKALSPLKPGRFGSPERAAV